MSELRDFYVDKIGHEPQKLEVSSWYLSELSLHAALEIDNYLIGRNRDFSHTRELTQILGMYRLYDTDTALTVSSFPYLPLWRVVKQNSEKEIKQYSELALEMKLLQSELHDVPTNSPQLPTLRSFLVDLSREFSRAQDKYELSRRMVA